MLEDVLSALAEVPALAGSTSSSMASARHCRSSGERIPASLCFACARSFAGTTAHMPSRRTRCLLYPRAPGEAPREIEHLTRQALAVLERGHESLGRPHRHGQARGLRLVGLVYHDSID